MLINYIIVLLLLFLCAYQDIKYREIMNLNWILMIASGFVLLFHNGFQFLYIAYMIVVVAFLFIFEDVIPFGKGDTRVLIGVAVLLPYPLNSNLPPVLVIFAYSLMFSVVILPVISIKMKMTVSQFLFCYKYPFVVSILFGTVFYLIFGDVLFSLMNSIGIQ